MSMNVEGTVPQGTSPRTTDLLAGVAIAAVAIPTALAYADLAGFPPVVGLYASILPLIAYAMAGSSPQLIVGTDAATCALVAAALTPLTAGSSLRQMELSITLSVLVGALCLAGSILRLGALANFLSRPVLVGFLNGMALTIISGQFGKLCGFAVRRRSGNPTGRPKGAKNFETELNDELQETILSVRMAALSGSPNRER